MLSFFSYIGQIKPLCLLLSFWVICGFVLLFFFVIPEYTYQQNLLIQYRSKIADFKKKSTEGDCGWGVYADSLVCLYDKIRKDSIITIDDRQTLEMDILVHLSHCNLQTIKQLDSKLKQSNIKPKQLQ